MAKEINESLDGDVFVSFCDLPQLAKEKSSFENVKPLSMQKFPWPNRGTGASVQLLATRSTRELKSVVC